MRFLHSILMCYRASQLQNPLRTHLSYLNTSYTYNTMKVSSVLTALVTLLPLVNALPTKSSLAETAVSAAIQLLSCCNTLTLDLNRRASSRGRPHALTSPASKTLIVMETAAGTATWILDTVPVHQRLRADLARLVLWAGMSCTVFEVS